MPRTKGRGRPSRFWPCVFVVVGFGVGVDDVVFVFVVLVRVDL